MELEQEEEEWGRTNHEYIPFPHSTLRTKLPLDNLRHLLNTSSTNGWDTEVDSTDESDQDSNGSIPSYRRPVPSPSQQKRRQQQQLKRKNNQITNWDSIESSIFSNADRDQIVQPEKRARIKNFLQVLHEGPIDTSKPNLFKSSSSSPPPPSIPVYPSPTPILKKRKADEFIEQENQIHPANTFYKQRKLATIATAKPKPSTASALPLLVFPKVYPFKSNVQSFLAKEIIRLEKQQEDDIKKRRRENFIPSRYSLPFIVQIKICEGDKIVKNIWWALDSLGLNRTTDQIDFNRSMVYANLANIYQDDWPIYASRIMHDYDLKEIDYLLLFHCARRWGKTIAVSIFGTVMLLHRPGIEIPVFSTGGRVSGKLMEEVVKLLLGQENAARRIVKQSKEELYISQFPLPIGCTKQSPEARLRCNEKNTSRFYSYPSGSDSQYTYIHKYIYIPIKIVRSIERETDRRCFNFQWEERKVETIYYIAMQCTNKLRFKNRMIF